MTKARKTVHKELEMLTKVCEAQQKTLELLGTRIGRLVDSVTELRERVATLEKPQKSFESLTPEAQVAITGHRQMSRAG